jgi:hypothetical protein
VRLLGKAEEDAVAVELIDPLAGWARVFLYRESGP